MPGRKPPRRGETGNGFMAPPRRGVERRRRTSPSSTTAASVVRSLAACARAWASNSSRMSTVAFTINHRTTHFAEAHAVAQGVFSIPTSATTKFVDEQGEGASPAGACVSRPAASAAAATPTAHAAGIAARVPTRIRLRARPPRGGSPGVRPRTRGSYPTIRRKPPRAVPCSYCCGSDLQQLQPSTAGAGAPEHVAPGSPRRPAHRPRRTPVRKSPRGAGRHPSSPPSPWSAGAGGGLQWTSYQRAARADASRGDPSAAGARPATLAAEHLGSTWWPSPVSRPGGVDGAPSDASDVLLVRCRPMRPPVASPRHHPPQHRPCPPRRPPADRCYPPVRPAAGPPRRKPRTTAQFNECCDHPHRGVEFNQGHEGHQPHDPIDW